MSVPNSTSGVGRFTALVLGIVVFVCVTMIGGTSYLKYQLDKAETVLAAPDNIPGSNQDLYGELRSHWGYGGFLGFAQKYVSLHDVSGFAEVKESIKSANAIVAQLPEGTPDETRRELSVMATLFDAALQKINAPVDGASPVEFTTSDLAPLYAALPILDARINSGNADTRLAAQKKAQFWSMLLTLATWGSLIVTAACVVSIYQILRDKRSVPMRALAQSIQNMAQGDMRTAIWGIERQDMIGEVARAIDIARYHFSHLPDISLLSEQGPVRMRFEGGTRSLFEAMMKAISSDSENIRQQSTSLTSAIAQQKESVSALSAKIESVLNNIMQRGQNGDQQIKLAITEMVVSAENLKNAHAHAADQLARLIPNIQDRAQGLADITQATGKQLSHTLQSLTSSEISLKANADQAKATLAKLSSTADDLGERLFGAINLLQASGKVMAETTENIKSRWSDASSALPLQEISLAPLSERLEDIQRHLETLQDRLDAQAAAQTRMPDAPETSVLAPISSHLEQITGQLSSLQAQLDEHARAQSEMTDAFGQNMDQNRSAQKDGIAKALFDLNEKISGLFASIPADLRLTLQEDFQRLTTQKDIALLNDKMSELAELNAKACVFTSAIPGDLRQTLREALAELAEKNDLTELNKMLAAIKADMDRTQGSAPEFARQIGEIGLNLAEQINASHSKIDKTLRQEIAAKLSEFENILVSTQQTAAATQVEMSKPAQTLRDALAKLAEKNDVAELNKMLAAIKADMESAQGATPEFTRQIGEIGLNLVEQINTSHSKIDKTLRQEIAAKLSAFENILVSTQQTAEATQVEVSKPAPPQALILPPELKDQLLDQWFQVSAQIESSRGSVLDSLSTQVNKIENSLAIKQSFTQPKSVADFSLQIQIEKQTQILTELVTTLGLLDADLQKIKSEMHEAG